MTLSSPSIAKIFREQFSADVGLSLLGGERDAFAERFTSRFEGDPWIELERHVWLSKTDIPRHLKSFTIRDPDHDTRYYYEVDTFHLFVGAAQDLEIKSSHSGLTAKVTSLGEIESMIAEIKRRLERRRALRSRRTKVRGFKQAAMVAQLKEVARAEKFQCLPRFTTQRITLWIRMNDRDDAVHIHFAPRRFQELLPQLPDIVRGLKAAFETGVSFKTVTRYGLPWNKEWVGYGVDEAAEDDG